MKEIKERYPDLQKLYADMGYTGKNLKDYIMEKHNIELEIVKRPPTRFWIHKDIEPPIIEGGFKLLPKRWIVERTLAWINRNRRLSKEYDMNTSTSESFIYLAMNKIILKRITA